MVANVGDPSTLGSNRRKFRPKEITRALFIAMNEDFGSTAFAILRNLISASPVGNPDQWALESLPPPPGYVGGHFRRNWQVVTGIGGEPAELDGVDTTAGAEPLARGKAQIDKAGQSDRTIISIVILNNVPYANRLAQGWSRQAEAGWIDQQIDAALPLPPGKKVLP